MYEVFEHTADLGLRIRAADLNELFAEAGRALFSVIVVNFHDIRPFQELTFRLQADAPDELLHDWLAELLYTFHVSHVVFAEFAVDIHDGHLRATARGETTDADRHELDSEIKAITYHRLRVEQDGGGWLAEVIVDI